MRSAKGGMSKIREGYWKLTVELGRDADGKRRQKSRYVRGSRKKAQEALNALLAEAGEADAKSLVTVESFAKDVYLPLVRAKRKTKTYEAYESRLRLHVLPVLGGTRFADLTPAKVNELLSSLKPTVAKEARKTLSAMFTEAVYQGYLPSNPCDAVRPVEVAAYEPEVLDEAEIAEYLRHYRGHAVEPAVLLAIGGGFRRGEIAALDVEDIDFATGAVAIDNSMVVTRNGTEDTDTKTHRRRVVHLPMTIVERLNDILPQSGALMLDSRGERINPSRIQQLYKARQKTLPEGVTRVTLKNLRHSSLTLAYDSGVDIQDVANRGGHTSISTTTRYYVRPTGERDIRAAQMMDEALSTIVNNSGESSAQDEAARDFERLLRRVRIKEAISF